MASKAKPAKLLRRKVVGFQSEMKTREGYLECGNEKHVGAGYICSLPQQQKIY